MSLCLSVSSFRWSFVFRSLPFYGLSSVSVSIDIFCLSVSSVSFFFLVGLSCSFRLCSLFSLLFRLSISSVFLSRSLLGLFRFVLFCLLLCTRSILYLCFSVSSVQAKHLDDSIHESVDSVKEGAYSVKEGLISSERGLIPSMRG